MQRQSSPALAAHSRVPAPAGVELAGAPQAPEHQQQQAPAQQQHWRGGTPGPGLAQPPATQQAVQLSVPADASGSSLAAAAQAADTASCPPGRLQREAPVPNALRDFLHPLLAADSSAAAAAAGGPGAIFLNWGPELRQDDDADSDYAASEDDKDATPRRARNMASGPLPPADAMRVLMGGLAVRDQMRTGSVSAPAPAAAGAATAAAGGSASGQPISGSVLANGCAAWTVLAPAGRLQLLTSGCGKAAGLDQQLPEFSLLLNSSTTSSDALYASLAGQPGSAAARLMAALQGRCAFASRKLPPRSRRQRQQQLQGPAQQQEQEEPQGPVEQQQGQEEPQGAVEQQQGQEGPQGPVEQQQEQEQEQATALGLKRSAPHVRWSPGRMHPKKVAAAAKQSQEAAAVVPGSVKVPGRMWGPRVVVPGLSWGPPRVRAAPAASAVASSSSGERLQLSPTQPRPQPPQQPQPQPQPAVAGKPAGALPLPPLPPPAATLSALLQAGINAMELRGKAWLALRCGDGSHLLLSNPGAGKPLWDVHPSTARVHVLHPGLPGALKVSRTLLSFLGSGSKEWKAYHVVAQYSPGAAHAAELDPSQSLEAWATQQRKQLRQQKQKTKYLRQQA